MSSNFFEKFQGKMSNIPKQGVNSLFKSTERSFAPTRVLREDNSRSKNTQEISFIGRLSKGIKQQEEIRSESRGSLHLPSIGQRYRSQQQRQFPQVVLRKGYQGHVDKETNWIIEQKIRQTSPLQRTQNSASMIQILKESLVNRLTSKYSQKGRNQTLTKLHKLGGLGANIGGQEWQLRNKKHQKAKEYADQIRRKLKVKANTQNQDPIQIPHKRTKHSFLD